MSHNGLPRLRFLLPVFHIVPVAVILIRSITFASFLFSTHNSLCSQTHLINQSFISFAFIPNINVIIFYLRPLTLTHNIPSVFIFYTHPLTHTHFSSPFCTFLIYIASLTHSYALFFNVQDLCIFLSFPPCICHIVILVYSLFVSGLPLTSNIIDISHSFPDLFSPLWCHHYC